MGRTANTGVYTCNAVFNLLSHTSMYNLLHTS